MRNRRARLRVLVAGSWIVAAAAVPLTAGDNVAGNLILFNDNGGWCWYQDERAIVDTAHGRLLIGSVKSSPGSLASDGNVDVTTFDLATGSRSRFTLADINEDDHNAPALLVRPDGRYLALYGNHNTDRLTRFRVSTNPFDSSSWTAEQRFDWTTTPGNDYNATYSNVFHLPAENRTYNFVRVTDRSPNMMLSTDQGSSWTYGGQLTRSVNVGYVNGYFKYTSNGLDRIDLVGTEAHPRDYNTSIYHAYIQNGRMYSSDGALIDDDVFDGSFVPGTAQLTPVFLSDPEDGTQQRTRAWTIDVAVDGEGRPYTVFSTRAGDVPVNSNGYNDHRFFYARYDGSGWNVHELARAGARLFTSEQDYTGLAALDPSNPDSVYVSTPIDPRSGTATANHEIYRGTTGDGGATWSWTAMTSGSNVDNYRPIVLAWGAGSKAVLWNRGTMTTSQNYDEAVVGVLERPDETVGLAHYVDATTANTTRSDGTPISATGPSSSAGRADGRWHWRTGYGNGGNGVLTSGESGTENAPVLKTTLSGLPDGTYDLFALFWANPSADWRLRFGLSSSQLNLARDMAAQQAEAAQFDGPVTLTGSTVALYRAYVGRATVAAGSPVSVYVDDQVSTSTGTTRTWYDGIGYALVTPVDPGQGGAGTR